MSFHSSSCCSIGGIHLAGEAKAPLAGADPNLLGRKRGKGGR